MCGRAFKTFTDKELEQHYLIRNPGWKWPAMKSIPERLPSFNFCPTQKSLVLCVIDGKIGFHEMRWGLVPFWANTVKDADKYSLINAKAEEIADKRSYKIPFQKRRCIVPISGFFEWKRTADKKRPFAIHLKNHSVMGLAGIWEQWVSKETGEEVCSFALITTEANSLMAPIHNRMPVILDEKDEETWLDPENQDVASLQKLLKPCPSSWLEAYEVSTLVNSPKNNVGQILQPL
jgi:putative SOS response-associated peptidase YedK